MAGTYNVQWFPGHMTKTFRQMKENLSLVDAVTEIVDARIPKSSRNPDLDALFSQKPRIILLNKYDFASEAVTAQWISFYQSQGIEALAVNCKTGKGLNSFLPLIRKVLKDKLEQNARKGMVGKSLRVMVVGIPNVGKSSFINCMAGRNRAKTADKPGVTRGSQWFAIDKGIELLDTPGVLWPKFDDLQTGEHLAFTGAIKDEVMDSETLALRLLTFLMSDYLDCLAGRYSLENIVGQEPLAIMRLIAKQRGALVRGGEVDYERVSVMLLDEFRGGKLGKITLEKP